MKKIKYISGNEDLLDSIGFLWEKLNKHHENSSKYFSEKFSKFTFEVRKKGLIDKAKRGFMKVEIARDVEKNINIGYCISTINDRNIGEIESLYVEPDYRKLGIGNEFMRNALDWMDLNNVKSICIGVSVGNEEVLSFYKKYGFFPKTIILEQVNNKYK
ncbi:GNAT family N-acetyltransferase [Caloranaerobacter azorensis]|uniref:GNAT family N-acetyltransferase n=1 Tax=Caloranaerobacter azorensis TaxID=116090 RepID=A0A6P1YCK6_9FIRM|nr:GNAT family N-acetyltransferase [Caloranaerobacter azorensis]QIB26463.1 GNAT family N-acetyltransferase [Caloranaerobacter azorensis]